MADEVDMISSSTLIQLQDACKRTQDLDEVQEEGNKAGISIRISWEFKFRSSIELCDSSSCGLN